MRWLRPDYQIPKLGRKAAAIEAEQMEADMELPDTTALPIWPGDGLEQIRIVHDLLAKAQAPVAAESRP